MSVDSMTHASNLGMFQNDFLKLAEQRIIKCHQCALHSDVLQALVGSGNTPRSKLVDLNQPDVSANASLGNPKPAKIRIAVEKIKTGILFFIRIFIIILLNKFALVRRCSLGHLSLYLYSCR